ncbi:MAG: hypothetical protein ACXW6K_19910 [Candidatus Binatia bacterium]
MPPLVRSVGLLGRRTLRIKPTSVNYLVARTRLVLLDITPAFNAKFGKLPRRWPMAEHSPTEFTYSRVQRLLQESSYDDAIALLSQRVECQPLDRAARLLLLLANMSKFGPGDFNRQIEEIKFMNELTGNERYIVQQIFLVGFRHAAQEGQTIQKIVYQCLLRRLMLGHSLDVAISQTREIEEECSNPASAEDISPTLGIAEMKPVAAEPEMAPLAPARIRSWRQHAMIGAGAVVTIVLLGFYVATEPKAPLAQQPSRPIALLGSGIQTETGADSKTPAVVLAPTFTAEPARRLIVGQLGKLKRAYARWSKANPFTSGTVSLKLSIEPSGKIAKVEEVLSRLSEHQFLDVVVAEVKQWKLPLGGTKPAEISVPLIFIPAKDGPAQLAAEGKSREPGAAREGYPTKQTSFAAAKRKLAATSSLPDNETEIARTAALKHEPRFAANVIEKVGLGTRVTVLRKERDWIKVKVKTSGKIGYMRKEYLAAAAVDTRQ